jgi:hypothetical protein
MATVTREIVNNRTQLDTLSRTGHSIRAAMDNPLAPYFDGRIPEGDVRSPALKSAIADLLAAADRVAAQAKTDLALWTTAERADTRNREAHERAEQGKQI